MTNNIPEFLKNKDLRLIFFGGKGGVGKTTMAAASALHLAISRGENKKVLVISTDPAHSLADSFGVEIGDRVTAIQRSEIAGQISDVGDLRSEVGSRKSEVRAKTRIECPQSKIQNSKFKIQNLFARELDAGGVLDEFKRKNQDVIKKLAERGTYFDQEDIAGFVDLSLPGMDEVMAVIEIADLLKVGTYDIVIVDTAPTGHTVRMLNLPEQMLKWIETMDLMQHKHRYMSEVFSGKKYRKDACDRFLEDLSSDIDRVRRLLSNIEMTRFVPVMIPEPMSIYETERLIGSLEKNGVPIKEMIVNHVAESEGCIFCRSRKEDQERPLKEIDDRFSAYDRIRIPAFPHEIRGISGLRTIAKYLSGTFEPVCPVEQGEVIETPSGCLALDSGLEFVLIGGKGGVGKTTLASSVAIFLARHNPGKRVLLFSTDPAHSLSDSLNQPIGDEITPVQSPMTNEVSVQGPESKVQSPLNDHRMTMNDGRRSNDVSVQSPMTNLYALEIDADRLWGNFKEAFKNDIAALFDRFVARGADIRFDREVMSGMLELAPPGVDEIMSLDRIMDLRNEGEFDIFVLDTSPTGHLLRFLELPDLAREWLKAFFSLLVKYKGVVSLAGAAEKALALSKNVRRIQETLTDPERTDFVATTIPEAMGVSELERLMLALQTGNIPCRHIVVNKAVPETDCGFCSVKRAEQQDYVRKIASMFPDRTIVQAPLFPRQIRGIEDLRELGDAVFCNNHE
ncbi:MAG: ArsA family ATPase [Deltaproteobacteria bacterium]|nr:ArsA family ATPase [Deltaproteobacteria bacterium]